MVTPSDFSTAPASGPARTSPPYIPTASAHFGYALLIVDGGFEHAEACRILELNPRTVERWRRQLRDVGADHFGREVSYEFCARHAVALSRTPGSPFRQNWARWQDLVRANAQPSAAEASARPLTVAEV